MRAQPEIHVVIGLGFGDEGKGTIVDWLARQSTEPPLVVRWNGGPQAAHHVVTDDGRSHCFAQFGSASFVDGAATHIGRAMAIDPYALHVEAAALARVGIDDVLTRTTIDPRCLLVTPWHAVLNRVRECLRGGKRHGTTGRGVGEAKRGAVQLSVAAAAQDLALLRDARSALLNIAGELIDSQASAPTPLRDLARALVVQGQQPWLLEEFTAAVAVPLQIAVTPPLTSNVIFESAQGALLDQDHGYFPHVTPSSITRVAAQAAMHELGFAPAPTVWGVLRAVHTRHGEGPLPSFDPSLTAALPEQHNSNDGDAGQFRVGWFDGVLARRAIGFAGPIDQLVITCLDRVETLATVCVVDHWAGTDPLTAVAQPHTVPSVRPAIEQMLGRIIDLESWGPTASAKRLRNH
jgi:adenylosuccinate synthase